MRRKHQITQAAVAERLGLSIGSVQQFEHKTQDPRYSTLVKYKDALLALIEEKGLREREEWARVLRLAEEDPKNQWLVDAIRKKRNYNRSHRLEWVRAKSARYPEGRSGGRPGGSGTTTSDVGSEATDGS